MRKNLLCLYFSLLFSPAFSAEQAAARALVYSNPSGSPEVEETAGFYHRKYYPELRLARADAPGAPDAALLVGTPDGFPLLKRRLAAFPVEFTEAGFRLGGAYYTRNCGLVIAWSEGGLRTELRAGASWHGAWTTFYVSSTAAREALAAAGDAPAYFITFPKRGGGQILRRGAFVKTREGYKLDAEKDRLFADDPRAAYEEKMLARKGEDITYHYLPGSWAEKDIKKISSAAEKDVAELKAYLGADAAVKRVRYYFYDSREEKERLTGMPGNAHANNNAEEPEVHAVYSRELNATGKHEFVHLLAFRAWGRPRTLLMDEGLAVALTGDWHGKPFSYWGADLRGRNALPSLKTLASDHAYWGKNSSDAYAIAGHFTDFLLKEFGKDKVKELYRSPFNEDTVEKTLGLALPELEKRWLERIAAEAAPAR